MSVEGRAGVSRSASFWHPLSTVFLDEPRALASPVVLRMMLRSEGRVELLYAGDGMWPSVGHGQRLVAERLDPASVRAGQVVLACPSGIPDILRVTRADDPAHVHAIGDADPSDALRLEREAILAAVRAPARGAAPPLRWLRRLWLDLAEAARGAPDRAADPADTVQAKYEAQAPFYSREGTPIEQELLSRIGHCLPRAGHLLVLGSGSGKECFTLAERGFEVTGIDFAPAMVAASREEAARRGLAVRFEQADLRTHAEAPGSVDCVLFTYDVYSFLPDPDDRVRLLERIRGWLPPAGCVFLSARLARSARSRTILWLQHVARGRRAGRAPGASHTRWITSQGELRRSFVHVFTEKGLRREIEGAGLALVEWSGGHGLLRARPG